MNVKSERRWVKSSFDFPSQWRASLMIMSAQKTGTRYQGSLGFYQTFTFCHSYHLTLFPGDPRKMRRKPTSASPGGDTGAQEAHGTCPGQVGCAAEGQTRLPSELYFLQRTTGIQGQFWAGRALSVGPSPWFPPSRTWKAVEKRMLSHFSGCLQGKIEEKGLNWRTDVIHLEELPVAGMIIIAGRN